MADPGSSDARGASRPERRRHAGSGTPFTGHPARACPNAPDSASGLLASTIHRWTQAETASRWIAVAVCAVVIVLGLGRILQHDLLGERLAVSSTGNPAPFAQITPVGLRAGQEACMAPVGLDT